VFPSDCQVHSRRTGCGSESLSLWRGLPVQCVARTRCGCGSFRTRTPLFLSGTYHPIQRKSVFFIVTIILIAEWSVIVRVTDWARLPCFRFRLSSSGTIIFVRVVMYFSVIVLWLCCSRMLIVSLTPCISLRFQLTFSVCCSVRLSVVNAVR
jgi:hypothetical protein